MKKNKKIIITGVACILVVALAIGGYFLSDKSKFISQQHNINNYISSLKSNKNIQNVLSQNYCSYTHQKYSEGSLNCNVGYTFQSSNKNLVTENFRKNANGFGWAYKWDNTDDNNKYSEEKYVKSEVYEYRGLYCGVLIKEAAEKYIYQIDCSGPAKWAWFPVIES